MKNVYSTVSTILFTSILSFGVYAAPGNGNGIGHSHDDLSAQIQSLESTIADCISGATTGCQGPQGPAGPEGPEGPQGENGGGLSGTIVTSGADGQQFGSLTLSQAAILGAVAIADNCSGDSFDTFATIVNFPEIGYRDLVRFNQYYLCSENSVDLIYTTDDCSGTAYHRRAFDGTNQQLSNILGLSNTENYGLVRDSVGGTYSIYRFFPDILGLISDFADNQFPNGNYAVTTMGFDGNCIRIALSPFDNVYQRPELVLESVIPPVPYTVQLLN